MKTYTSSGMKSVSAETMKEAGAIFAARLARREFGARGEARTCTIGAYSQDGTLGEFSAFIGLTKGHETTGRNVSFTVRANE